MKKVLLCSPYNSTINTPGGISVWAQNIVSYNKEHNEEIIIEVISTDRSKPMNENTGKLKRLYYGVKDYLGFIKQIRKKLDTKQYDVIHINTTASISSLKDLVICRIAKKRGVKTVLHYHFGRIPELIIQNNWEWKLLHKAITTCDMAIVMDNMSYDALCGIGITHVVNIPNPYSPALEHQIEKLKGSIKRVPKRVLFVSRVFRKKGIYELVEACNKISNITLRVVGSYEESDKQNLLNMAKEGNWLDLVGPVPHDKVLEELMACDLFVLPTYTEGFPNAILESMLCEAPTIVTPVGAIPQMLDFAGEPCGYSIRPQNVDDIVNAILDLLNDNKKKIEMTERGVKRVKENYSLSAVCQHLYSVWYMV